MSGNILEGTNQPGIPRLARSGDREHDNVLDYPLGNATGGVLKRVAELVDVSRLCLWPKDNISIQSCWGKIRQALGEEIVSIEKVVRVHQADRIRFDIYVKREARDGVLDILLKWKNRLGFWVRKHVNYYDRDRGVTLGRAPPELEVSSVRVVSWNINSIAKKRSEVEEFLRMTNTKILCLQETRRETKHWPLRFQGFQVFESLADNNGEHHRGLSIIIHKDLVAYEVESSPFSIGIKIMLGTDEWTVMNVYLPSKPGEIRKFIEGEIRSTMTSDSKFLVMGDWNTKPDRLDNWFHRVRLGVNIVPGVGALDTYHGRQNWSCIDHMAASAEALPMLRKVRVNRSWDLSDHWPLECLIRTPGFHEQAAEGDRVPSQLDAKRLKSQGEAVRDSNCWRVLGDELAEVDDVNVVADSFETTVQQVTTELNLLRPSETAPSKHYRLNRAAKVAINRRRVAYGHWLREEAPAKSVIYEAYCERKTQADRVKNACSQASWLRFIVKGSLTLTEGDMKGFWNWSKQVLGKRRNGPSDFGPLYDSEEQNLVYDSQGKMEVVRSYYATLLGDPTGHSRDAAYWFLKLPGPASPPMEELNEDIRWVEINDALGRLRPGAPGRDGLPPEFFKLARDSGEVGEVASSEFGKTLTLILSKVWDGGIIPDKWNEAWVVSIFKDGDPKKLNNYRGISLIVVILKILTKVITTRLGKVLDRNKWFIDEQAGFRPREECAGHVCALYEILKRRSLMGKRSYVAFVDIKKAYDTVPIEALLRKLELLGMSGKCLTFLQALYADPKIRVRAKHSLSMLVSQLRGLKQGCNASPLLFNIFINDIMAGCKDLGVRLIGLDRNQREVGLLFADDLVLLCGRRSHLCRALCLIQRWADTFEMTFGVDKCGIMGFGNGAMDRLRASPDRWRLSGRNIPVVNSYKYLGLIVTPDLELTDMVNDRVTKGMKTLNSMRSVIACMSIPIDIRIRAIRAILVPVLSYGGELWGMSEERSAAPQKVLTEALKLVLRISSKSTITSPWTLCLEFGVLPIHCVVSAARARAFRKFGDLKTPIAKLLTHYPVARKKTWVTGTRLWLNRFCRGAVGADSSVAASMVKTFLLDKLVRTSKSKTAETFMDSGLLKSRGYLKKAVNFPLIYKGVHILCRLRVGAFWTIRRFVHIGWLPERLLTLCPFCNTVGTGETIHHLVVECTAWEIFRPDNFRDLPNLLGGSGEPGGVGLVGASLTSWLGHENMEFQPDLLPQEIDRELDSGQLPGFIRVAMFLMRMIPVRQRRLNQLLRDAPGADANNNGMADFADEVRFEEDPD